MKQTVETTLCDMGDNKVARGSITWKRNGTSHVNDLCMRHLKLLENNSHAPTRGRKPGGLKQRRTRVSSKS